MDMEENRVDDLTTINTKHLHEQVHDCCNSRSRWYVRSGLPFTELGIELAELIYHGVEKNNREKALQLFSERVRWTLEQLEKRGGS